MTRKAVEPREAVTARVDQAGNVFPDGFVVEREHRTKFVYGRINYDLTWLAPHPRWPGAKERLGRDAVMQDPDSPGARARWVAGHMDEINAFFSDNFGVEAVADEGYTRGYLNAQLTIYDDDTFDVSAELHDLIDTIEGRGGQPIFERFWEHLAERRAQIDEAEEGIIKAALASETVVCADGSTRTLADADLHPQDFASDTRRLVRDVARRFTLEARHMIDEAREEAAERGREVSVADLAGAYLLARNGHRSLLGSTDLGFAGDDMRILAKLDGPFRLRVEDGKIRYVEPHLVDAAA